MLAVLGLAIERLHPRATVPHVLTLLAAFVITVAAAQWLYVLLERPLLRLLHTRRLVAPAAGRTYKPAAEADIKALARDAVV
jgi:peptidoglycan/LPS O-acetylase OafA/YrhL